MLCEAPTAPEGPALLPVPLPRRGPAADRDARRAAVAGEEGAEQRHEEVRGARERVFMGFIEVD